MKTQHQDTEFKSGATQDLDPTDIRNKSGEPLKKLPVIELFGPTIQGEGAIVGVRSHFIRFGGCSYRCTWCDSLHAVLPSEVAKNSTRMTPLEIVKKIDLLPPAPWVTLTGGDPVMWDLESLIMELGLSYFIAIETQGALYKDWLKICDLVTISPKAPSSGMIGKLDIDTLDRYTEELESSRILFKIVIDDEQDLNFAEALLDRYPNECFSVSACTKPGKTLNETRINVLDKYTWLCEEILKRRSFDGVVALPQLHTLIWGTEKGR